MLFCSTVLIILQGNLVNWVLIQVHYMYLYIDIYLYIYFVDLNIYKK